MTMDLAEVLIRCSQWIEKKSERSYYYLPAWKCQTGSLELVF
jgi:hypothetical protein